ncbi:uncharacterized protein BDV17DRAFT_265850 [Aspergillus undulatus]|uniref:uncharacterized protein n=1 Tax=Aspergillus undulatus TaxID=1810928 RepID=UPI003CCE10F8
MASFLQNIGRSRTESSTTETTGQSRHQLSSQVPRLSPTLSGILKFCAWKPLSTVQCPPMDCDGASVCGLPSALPIRFRVVVATRRIGLAHFSTVEPHFFPPAAAQDEEKYKRNTTKHVGMTGCWSGRLHLNSSLVLRNLLGRFSGRQLR